MSRTSYFYLFIAKMKTTTRTGRSKLVVKDIYMIHLGVFVLV